MPTYEYKCDSCGCKFEKFQNMTDKPARKCPTCGGKVRRLIGTGIAIISKGSGDGYRPCESFNHCGLDAPCCGKDAPCMKPPCGS